MSTKSLVRNGNYLPTVFEDFFKPFNEWFDSGSNLLSRVLTVPAVNITETKDEYALSIAAPGMKKEDFAINIDGSMLTISSEKETTSEEKEEKFTRKEYNYTSFSRSFSLPDEVKKDNIQASYHEGILKLVLPKKEEAKKLAARSIEVR